MPVSGGAGIPRVSVSGSPHECGRQYGQVLKDRIRKTLAAYFDLFRHLHDLGPDQVFALAREFEPVAREYDPSLIDEMHGIAAGADIPFEAVLTINARSELVHGLKATLHDGCTSFGVGPSATRDGSVLVGQNWDWDPAIGATTTILDIQRDNEPRILTVTEAGLLGKIGVNEAGIGSCINFLLSEARRIGTPVHLIRRKVLSCTSITDAASAVIDADRALAGNYMIAHADGQVLDIEASPFDAHVLEPQDGILVHANHFTSSNTVGRDLGLAIFPDSALRARQLEERLRAHLGALDEDSCQEALRDHTGHPTSICRHLDETKDSAGQIETLGSVVINVTKRAINFCAGRPCLGSYALLSLHDA